MEPKITKQLVLGSGAAGDNKHVVRSDRVFDYISATASHVIDLRSTAVLHHHRHGRIILHAGRFHSYQQVEYNPMTNAVESVFD